MKTIASDVLERMLWSITAPGVGDLLQFFHDTVYLHCIGKLFHIRVADPVAAEAVNGPAMTRNI